MPTKTKQTEQQVILNNGAMQHLLSVPQDGLLVRLHIHRRHLVASFEEGSEQSGAACQLITQALNHLQVDPILDPDHPFKAYNPGVVCGN